MATVKKQLLSGFFYTAITRYSTVIISLLITSVLSRILVPVEFGLVAIATVFITFFGIISEMGLGPAIIQNKQLDDTDISHIFSFSIYLSLAFGLIFFFAATPLANFYDQPELKRIFHILSLAVFFSAANVVPNALMAKARMFKFIAFRTLVIQLLVGILAIAMALNGYGVYALLVNPVLGVFFILVFNLYKAPLRFTPAFRFFHVKKVLGFSSYQFLFNFINYFSRNADNIIIGKAMGMNPLAYYEKSYRLMTLPLVNVTSVITPVIQPIFSEFQDDKQKISDYYLKIVRLLALIGFPLTVYFYFTAREIVLIVFGNQWELSVPVFRILALSVGFQVILSSSGAVFQAANSVRLLFISGLVSAVLMVSGILTGVYIIKTLEGVATCIVIAFGINFIQSFYLLFNRALGTPLSKFFLVLVRPVLVYGSVLLAVLYGADRLTAGANIWFSCIIKSMAALVTFMLIAYLLKDLGYMTSIFRRKGAAKPSLEKQNVN